jgi:hypothetical protein
VQKVFATRSKQLQRGFEDTFTGGAKLQRTHRSKRAPSGRAKVALQTLLRDR